MNGEVVAVSSTSTTQIVAREKCPANLILSNVGSGVGSNGIVYVSHDGNAYASQTGVPIPVGGRIVWGRVNAPLYAYAFGETTNVLATYCDSEDEFQI